MTPVSSGRLSMPTSGTCRACAVSGGAFLKPIAWALSAAPAPYYYGAVTVNCTAPAMTQDTEEYALAEENRTRAADMAAPMADRCGGGGTFLWSNERPAPGRLLPAHRARGQTACTRPATLADFISSQGAGERRLEWRKQPGPERTAEAILSRKSNPDEKKKKVLSTWHLRRARKTGIIAAETDAAGGDRDCPGRPAAAMDQGLYLGLRQGKALPLGTGRRLCEFHSPGVGSRWRPSPWC